MDPDPRWKKNWSGSRILIYQHFLKLILLEYVVVIYWFIVKRACQILPCKEHCWASEAGFARILLGFNKRCENSQLMLTFWISWIKDPGVQTGSKTLDFITLVVWFQRCFRSVFFAGSGSKNTLELLYVWVFFLSKMVENIFVINYHCRCRNLLQISCKQGFGCGSRSHKFVRIC